MLVNHSNTINCKNKNSSSSNSTSNSNSNSSSSSRSNSNTNSKNSNGNSCSIMMITLLSIVIIIGSIVSFCDHSGDDKDHIISFSVMMIIIIITIDRITMDSMITLLITYAIIYSLQNDNDQNIYSLHIASDVHLFK